jgi:CHASE2 domain-containing sensor protein
MQKNFYLNLLFFTLFLFGFIGLVSLLPINSNYIDPIGEAVSDFAVDDIVFSQIRRDTGMGKNPTVLDERIVLVNVGYYDRATIAEAIRRVSTAGPKVIGVDVLFRRPKEISQDSALVASLSGVRNLVMVSSISKFNPASQRFDSLETSDPMFMNNAKTGFGNLVTEGDEESATCRSLVPVKMVGNDLQVAFAVKMAQLYDAESAHKFLYRSHEEEFINFRRNIREGTGGYYVFDAGDFIVKKDTNTLAENAEIQDDLPVDLLRDKIVIFGFMGDRLNPKDIEDKYFTPMNRQYAGKAFADMYGVVIHANVLSMILDKDYLNQSPDWVSWVTAVVVCLLNATLFTLILKKITLWYGAITKTLQVLEILVLAVIVVYALHFYNLKINLTLTAIIIALIGDLLEIYYSVIVVFFGNLIKRFSRKKTADAVQ